MVETSPGTHALYPLPLTKVFPFFMSTSLSKTAAKLGSSDSTDQMGGTAGYDS